MFLVVFPLRPAIKYIANVNLLSQKCLLARRFPSCSSSSLSAFSSVVPIPGLQSYPHIDKNKFEFRAAAKKALKPDKVLDLKSKTVSSEIFGDISDSIHQRRLQSEYLPEDDDNYDQHDTFSDKKHPIWYRWKMRELIESRGKLGLREALELYQQMRVEDGFSPDKTHFTFLIGGCAQAGYTERAFELFEDMLKLRDRNYTAPTMATITSLFNAAANCPFPAYGLEKAKYLRDYLASLDKFPLNQSHYHAMIKAYGKCGDLAGAFEIVDEMAANKIKISGSTCSMLLMGCVSARDQGMYVAVQVIRRMKRHRIKYEPHHFNLLLRAVRDCRLGSLEEIQSLFHEWDSPSSTSSSASSPSSSSSAPSKAIRKRWASLAPMNSTIRESGAIQESSPTNSIAGAEQKQQEVEIRIPERPNLLEATSTSLAGQIVGINMKALNFPDQRLSLLGGVDGILSMMDREKVAPDLKTMSLLLDLSPRNAHSEKGLLDRMVARGVEADLDFYNMLVKRCTRRGDLYSARPILKIIAHNGLAPDAVTFGNLALGCKTVPHLKELLTSMKSCGIQPNVVICTILLGQSIRHKQAWMAILTMNLFLEHDLPIIQKSIEDLEAFQVSCHQAFADYDHGRRSELPAELEGAESRKAFRAFSTRYADFKRKIKIATKEHPWRQFEVPKVNKRAKMNQFEEVMKRKIAERLGGVQEPPPSFSPGNETYEE